MPGVIIAGAVAGEASPATVAIAAAGADGWLWGAAGWACGNDTSVPAWRGATGEAATTMKGAGRGFGIGSPADNGSVASCFAGVFDAPVIVGAATALTVTRDCNPAEVEGLPTAIDTCGAAGEAVGSAGTAEGNGRAPGLVLLTDSGSAASLCFAIGKMRAFDTAVFAGAATALTGARVCKPAAFEGRPASIGADEAAGEATVSAILKGVRIGITRAADATGAAIGAATEAGAAVPPGVFTLGSAAAAIMAAAAPEGGTASAARAVL